MLGVDNCSCPGSPLRLHLWVLLRPEINLTPVHQVNERIQAFYSLWSVFLI